jgi:hypothetical protein
MTNTKKRDEPQGVVTLTPTHQLSQRSLSTNNRTQGNCQEQNNSHSGNSSNGGEEDPSKDDIEKSYIVLVHPKRKREITQKVGQGVLEFELREMEVDVVIGESEWVEKIKIQRNC